MSVYDLIIEEQWEKAIEVASKNYEETKDIFELRNLIPVLLIQKKYENCIRTIEEIWNVEGNNSDNEYIWAAIANVGMGNVEKSFQLLEESRDCGYSDATGGVIAESILYSIATFFDNDDKRKESLSRIGKIVGKSKKPGAWPSHIGLFLLERIGFEDMIDGISNMKSLNQKQKCQAFFYKGVFSYEDNWVSYFKECREQVPQAYFKYEYHLSKILEAHKLSTLSEL
jgi:hypothetical protein